MVAILEISSYNNLHLYTNVASIFIFFKDVTGRYRTWRLHYITRLYSYQYEVKK